MEAARVRVSTGLAAVFDIPNLILPKKKKVGEFQLEAALIPRETFVSSLHPEIVTTN